MANAINLTKAAFGSKTSTAAPAKEYAKAAIWLNIGYEVEVPVEDGSTETRFINLPMGLPLDTMEEVKTNSSNETFAAMQVAKNDLLKQLLAAAADLPPGGERIVKLQVQMRRVNEASNVALSNPDVNPFLKTLAF